MLTNFLRLFSFSKFVLQHHAYYCVDFSKFYLIRSLKIVSQVSNLLRKLRIMPTEFGWSVFRLFKIENDRLLSVFLFVEIILI